MTLDKVLRSPQDKDVMHGWILLVTMPRGHTPVFSLHPGTQKETILHSELLIDLTYGQVRSYMVHLFDPYKSKTTGVQNFY